MPEASLDGWSLSLAQQRGAVIASPLGRYRAGPDTFEIDWAGPGGYHQSLRRNDKLAAFSELETYIPCAAAMAFISPASTNSAPQPGGVGTYMLQNYTFYSRYNDGRQGRRAFLAPANEQPTGSFSWIQIGLEMNRVSP